MRELFPQTFCKNDGSWRCIVLNKDTKRTECAKLHKKETHFDCSYFEEYEGNKGICNCERSGKGIVTKCGIKCKLFHNKKDLYKLVDNLDDNRVRTLLHKLNNRYPRIVEEALAGLK